MEFTKEDEKVIEDNIAHIIYIADAKRGEKPDVKNLTYYPNTTINRIFRTVNTYILRRDGSETKEGYLDFVRKTCDQTFDNISRYSGVRNPVCVTLLTTLIASFQKVPKGVHLHMEEYRDQRGDHIYKVEAYLKTLEAKMKALTRDVLTMSPPTKSAVSGTISPTLSGPPIVTPTPSYPLSYPSGIPSGAPERVGVPTPSSTPSMYIQPRVSPLSSQTPSVCGSVETRSEVFVGGLQDDDQDEY